MRIEIISGSPRFNSVTKRVAVFLKNYLQINTTHEIGLIDLQEWDLGPLQSVFASVEKTAPEFRPLAERIFGADAFILVSPEYNGSYAPAMKNLLDHFPKQHRKPFSIVAASQGPMGGIRAALQMQLLVNALFGIASPYMLIVPGVDQKFSADGTLSDQNFQNSIHNFITEYLWLAEHLIKDKIVA